MKKQKQTMLREIGLYVVILLVILRFLIAPLNTAIAGKKAGLTEQYNSYLLKQRLLARQEVERTAKPATNASAIPSGVYAKGTGVFNIQADLIEAIRSGDEKKGLTVVNYELPEPVIGKNVSEVSVVLKLQGKMLDLIETLRAVENGKRLLMVKAIDINKAGNDLQFRPDPDGAAQGKMNETPTTAALPRETFQHIERALPDLVCILLVIMVAYLAAGRPAVDLRVQPAPAVKAAQGGKAAVAARTQPVQTPPSQPVDTADKVLRDRNIFSANGAYTDVNNKQIPANPYTLIGVIQGKETKAVFRDYTGAVITATKGQKMIDGAVITSIAGTSVRLKKDTETKELKAFDVLGRKKAEETATGLKNVPQTKGQRAPAVAPPMSRRPPPVR